MDGNHEQDRRMKLEKIRTLGLDPYSWTTKQLTSIASVRAMYRLDYGKDGGPRVVIAGRIYLRRGMGKLGFITINGLSCVNDQGFQIQLAMDHSRLSETCKVLTKNLDLGDILVAEGKLGATQTGEVTVWVEEFQVVAKALSTPPDKIDGLKEPETRYRLRHMDLWNPEIMQTMRYRSQIISEIRQFLINNDYLEVETPSLMSVAGGATARPFKTHHNALDIDLFLRIAPELYLKRLIIGGMGAIFEIGKNFRNEGIDARHNPEFTSLEAYQAFGDYKSMMQLTESLMCQVCRVVKDFPAYSSPFPVYRLVDLVPGDMKPEDRYAKFEEEIAPTLMKPTFITHLPSKLFPLAKVSEDKDYAEVFELFDGGMEVATGYSEQNDPDAQFSAFKSQAGDGHVMDQDFVDAMMAGMPPTGGMGLGVDRLVALITGQRSIRDVILFPLLKPKNGV